MTRKECSYCKAPIYDNNQNQSWKNDKGEMVLLCSKCSQSYISGLIEPGSESKKVARYVSMQTSMNKNKTNKISQPKGSKQKKSSGNSQQVAKGEGEE
eukprot:CAMPEP_0202972714 /NCGR_PEP_ID=MMETSP1396-20130829/40115_1 /ASSEMBLY_ACC=CAM_ASM_000872 /TAXON_ID= /ORGANISM="Pseudokeronopsis sp., Strain Brazil" /LENGTH=97 /DNA_ID=CAMNT_0049703495 /DNA_START=312 /DNA_END=605 /DNA_ORIENTATION=+